MAARPYKRRRLLIDPLQMRLLLITLAYFLTATTILAFALFLPLAVQLWDGTDAGRQAEASTSFLALHTRFWPALAVTLVFVSLHSILTSHRIAGPLYRFRTVFNEIRDGNLTPWVSLRRGDLLLKEADALGEMVVSLRGRIHEIAVQQQTVHRGLGALHRSVIAGSPSEARAQLRDVQASVDLLGNHIAAFHLSPDGEGQ